MPIIWLTTPIANSKLSKVVHTGSSDTLQTLPSMKSPRKAASKAAADAVAGEPKRRKGADGSKAKAGKQQDTPAAAPSTVANPIDIVNPELLQDSSRDVLQEQYKNAQPYLHCVMKDVFKPELLRQVREEIINNIQATYKETDLFKLFQTGDMGNLAKLDKEAAAKLPTLMTLKDALYSEQFRAFIRQVTGCGELADKTDCSCNVYTHGCHLLCHDDVIGTRRVSWIIYLTDPDEPWTERDGGALELYPCEDGAPHHIYTRWKRNLSCTTTAHYGVKHTPAVHPSLSHLPTWNTMAMFTVQPGQSFHSVQEVFAEDKPRMSISGWYHAPQEPDNIHLATLQQLQSRADQPQPQPATRAVDGAGGEAQDGGLQAGADNVRADQFQPFTDGSGQPVQAEATAAGQQEAEAGLSEDDLSFLVRYVNPRYLQEDAWKKIQEKFADDGAIELHQFLAKGLASRILAAVKAADAAAKLGSGCFPGYQAGVCGGWRAVGPAHKQRYLSFSDGIATQTAAGDATMDAEQGALCQAAGKLLAQVCDSLFRSAPFQRLICCFTTLNMVAQRGEVRRFRPGMDYTVAHYGILTRDPRLDVVLCFVDEGNGAENGPISAWDDGEVGGFEAYLLADDDKEGAAAEEVYRQGEQDSGVLNVSAAANSLNLVLRDEGLMKFVKYVSHAAPSSRWDVAMEYLPEDDSDDEQDQAAVQEEEAGSKAKSQTGKRAAKRGVDGAARDRQGEGKKKGTGKEAGGDRAAPSTRKQATPKKETGRGAKAASEKQSSPASGSKRKRA